MSSPETNQTASHSPGRRAWPWVFGVLVGIAACVAVEIRFLGAAPSRSAAAAASKAALPSAANPAGAVMLTEFTQPETRRWRTAPHGTQVCDGVTFICNGAIRTAGLNAAREGNHYPGAVLDVPMNRRGSRIHLLQAAENTLDMTDGTPYGRLILRYANGESRRIDLLFGIHGDDWLQDKGKPSEPPADPNSTVAWLQRRGGDGSIIRFYHTAMENPLPAVAISSIDFISPLSQANLLLFGLTVDDDPRPLATSYGPGESIEDDPANSIIFTLQDAAGQPAVGATLAWIARGPRARVDFPPFRSDSHGQVAIEVPRRAVREIDYRANGPDGSSTSGNLKPNAAGAFPPTAIVKLSASGLTSQTSRP